MRFEKWQALGNDYLIVEDAVTADLVREMCDRHFGVGGDGLRFSRFFAYSVPLFAMLAAHGIVAFAGWLQRRSARAGAWAGIAMGARGTDVARDVADVVLVDDDFGAIAAAVEQGRGIRENVGKALRFLLATNLSELLVAAGSLALSVARPMTAIQFLWINLLSDVAPALALGMEAPEPDVMRRPPRPPAERFMTLRRGLTIVYHGALNALAAAIAFYMVYRGREENVPEARTAASAGASPGATFPAGTSHAQRSVMNRWRQISSTPRPGSRTTSDAISNGSMYSENSESATCSTLPSPAAKPAIPSTSAGSSVQPGTSTGQMPFAKSGLACGIISSDIPRCDASGAGTSRCVSQATQVRVAIQ